MFQKEYFVYMMASRKGGAIYIGVTNNLEGRVGEHKQGLGSKHVTKYNIHSLVYYECFNDINEAIDWEKKLKRWRRDWKNKLGSGLINSGRNGMSRFVHWTGVSSQEVFALSRAYNVASGQSDHTEFAARAALNLL